MNAQLPEQFEQIKADFLDLDLSDRLTLLLEFANELPELPAHYSEHPDLLERVIECQSPVYIFVDVDEGDRVHMYARAPKESPTTRGFASILAQGLEGLTTEEALAVPDDFPYDLGLADAVSLLRLRGMIGMLARAKRQVREKIAA